MDMHAEWNILRAQRTNGESMKTKAMHEDQAHKSATGSRQEADAASSLNPSRFISPDALALPMHVNSLPHITTHHSSKRLYNINFSLVTSRRKRGVSG